MMLSTTTISLDNFKRWLISRILSFVLYCKYNTNTKYIAFRGWARFMCLMFPDSYLSLHFKTSGEIKSTLWEKIIYIRLNSGNLAKIYYDIYTYSSKCISEVLVFVTRRQVGVIKQGHSLCYRSVSRIGLKLYKHTFRQQ